MAIVAAVALIIYLSESHVFEPGYAIIAYFDYVGGLSEGAPVKLAGVDVGKVDRILPPDEKNPQVTLELWISRDVQIRRGAVARIMTLGLIGEKYVEITAGKGPELVKPGEAIEGLGPARFDELLRVAADLSDKISSTVESLNAIIASEEFRRNLWEGTADLRIAARDIKRASASLADLLDENKESLSETIAELRGAATSVREAADAASTAVADVAQDATELIGSARDILEENRGGIAQTVSNVEATSRVLLDFITDLQEDPRQLIFGKREHSDRQVGEAYRRAKELGR